MQNMIVRPTTVVIAGLLVVAATGPVWGQDRSFRYEQVARETRTLQLGAAGSLDLKNLSGDITVTAGNGRDVVVQILRRSRARSDADAKLGLERVTVEVDSRGERATVQERYQSERNARYSVDTSYEVTAPPGTRVTADSTSGNVTVKGIRGDLSVGLISGDITISDASRLAAVKTISGNVTVTGVETDGNVEVGSVSGNVILQQIKASRLGASAISGNVTARDVSCDSVRLTSMTDNVEYSGALARNGRYDLQSHSGNVTFIPTGNTGFEVQANTFSGEIRIDVPAQIKSTISGRSPRRSIRATIGDGSAVVVLTAFSGNVVIGKSKK